MPHMCPSASLSVLPSCQHTSGLPSQPHAVTGPLRHQPTGWEWKMTWTISKPGSGGPYGWSHALCPFQQAGRERTPRETCKVKIAETFLSWVQKWLREREPRYAVGWQVPLGRLETDLSVFWVFFLTLYIWGLITIIAACIKLSKTLFIILKFMTGGKFLMPNPRESHFIWLIVL